MSNIKYITTTEGEEIISSMKCSGCEHWIESYEAFGRTPQGVDGWSYWCIEHMSPKMEQMLFNTETDSWGFVKPNSLCLN